MIPNQITRLTADEADELLASNRRKVQHQNASTQRATRKLFPKNDKQLRLDAQVRTNLSNAGIVDHHSIADAQAAAQKLLAAGGRALPPPNHFGEHAGSARANASYLKNLRAANAPKR
jgi:hypothetical protein